MKTPESRIRMMIVAGTVCIGLCAAIWYVSPGPARDGCAVGAVQCEGDDPFCLRDPAITDGVCTRLCPGGDECGDGWCCVDHLGAGDRAYFVCAPPSRCAGGEGTDGASR